MFRRAALGAVLIALISLGVSCSGDDGDDGAAFCAAVSTAPSLDSVVRGFTDQEPVSLERSLHGAEEAFERVRDTAPEEIEDEATRLVEVVELIIETIRDNPDERSTVISDITEALEDHETVEEDAAAVSEHVERTCDLDLNSGLVEGTTTTVEAEPPTTAEG